MVSRNIDAVEENLALIEGALADLFRRFASRDAVGGQIDQKDTEARYFFIFIAAVKSCLFSDGSV